MGKSVILHACQRGGNLSFSRMRQFFLFSFFLLSWLLPCSANSPALANGIRQEYKGKVELWTLSLQAATTAEAQAKIWGERPDASAYAQKMWAAIKGSLDQDWTLEQGGWLLKLVCSMPAETMRAEVKPFRAEVKIRYTAKEAEALVTPLEGEQVSVKFDAPVRDVTAGQAAVFYQDEIMLGGGIII